MRILSVDCGIINLALIVLEIDDGELGSGESLGVSVHHVHHVNITQYTHRHLDRRTCKLPHTNELSDRLLHAMADHEPAWGHIDCVLIERQPIQLGSCQHVEELLFQRYREKAVKLQPNAMHKFFGLSDDYDTRKVQTTQIAAPYLQNFPEFTEAERRHDMGDAVSLALFYLYTLHLAKRKERAVAEARHCLNEDMLARENVTLDEWFAQFKCSSSTRLAVDAANPQEKAKEKVKLGGMKRNLDPQGGGGGEEERAAKRAEHEEQPKPEEPVEPVEPGEPGEPVEPVEHKKPTPSVRPACLPATCNSHDCYLARLNGHPRDARVFFDSGENNERHDYYVDWLDTGNFACREHTISVTTVADAFFKKFDADAVIRNIMKGKNYETGKYFGMTPKEIKDKWATENSMAAPEGTAMHERIERYYNGELALDAMPGNLKEVSQFQAFVHAETADLEPYRTEWLVFTDDETRITGSTDMLYVNKTAMNKLWKAVENGANAPDTLHLALYDWKRTKEIKKWNKWEKGFPPFQRFPNANFFKYSLQLNLYKYIIETFYHNVPWNGATYKNVVVDFVYLAVFHPKHRKYQLHRCLELQDEVREVIEIRRQSLKRLRTGEPALFPFDLSQGNEENPPVFTDGPTRMRRQKPNPQDEVNFDDA